MPSIKFSSFRVLTGTSNRHNHYQNVSLFTKRDYAYGKLFTKAADKMIAHDMSRMEIATAMSRSGNKFQGSLKSSGVECFYCNPSGFGILKIAVFLGISSTLCNNLQSLRRHLVIHRVNFHIKIVERAVYDSISIVNYVIFLPQSLINNTNCAFRHFICTIYARQRKADKLSQNRSEILQLVCGQCQAPCRLLRIA